MAPQQPSASKALLIYNALRLALFAVFVGLGYLAGLRSFALLAAALLLSGVASWFALRTQRIRAGMAVEAAVTASRAAKPIKKLKADHQAKIDAEDAYVDSLLAEQDSQN